MKQNLLKRYLLFMSGLFLNGFGVAFITKAALGTTPIAALPYTLSLIFPVLTLGNFTIIISMILILLQYIILRKDGKIIDILLQIPITFLFGYVIDFSMWILTGFQPQSYLIQMVSLLAGCVIIAFGAYFEVVADVTMLPADGFTRALTKVTGREFGTVKLITDSAQAGLALILGLVFLHQLAGVREGTVIGALLIGNLIKVISRTWKLQNKFGQ
ncbi:MAG: YitT family protein [Firmicutes bacterium]|nr:YitT family protein [Bacillota bacterium]